MSATDNKEDNNINVNANPSPNPTIRDKLSDAIDKAKVKIVGDEPATLTPAEEKISNNAKTILLALFGMVVIIVGLGTWVLYVKPDVSTELMTIIFSSAIVGAFTLGGNLINAIWGK